MQFLVIKINYFFNPELFKNLGLEWDFCHLSAVFNSAPPDFRQNRQISGNFLIMNH